MHRPPRILHADWSTYPEKCWVAEAHLANDAYRLSAPRRARGQIEEAIESGEEVLPVVVHSEDDLGRIVTAFPRRAFP